MPFDRSYYERYYRDPRTAVTSRSEVRDRARLIAAATRYVGLPVGRILDAGCGLGLLRAPLARLLPRAQYVGYEASEYLCQRHGWLHGRLERLPLRAKYELVICFDVMQYLGTPAAREAIARLGRVCRGMLYFGALTRGDWLHNCDQSRTDRSVHLRSAAWYRRELSRAFTPLGCGLWLAKAAPVTIWDLDRPRA
jgi:SAM-dependent methyltransferase